MPFDSKKLFLQIREKQANMLLSDDVNLTNFQSQVLFASAHLADVLNHHLDSAPNDVIFNLIKERNDAGYTLLHYVAPYPESLQLVLKRYPQHERYAAFYELNHDHLSVLHTAVYSPDSVQIICDEISNDADMLRLIEIQDKQGNNVLFSAIPYTQSFIKLWHRLPTDKQEQLVNTKNSDGSLMMHEAAEQNPQIFKFLLDGHAPNNQLKALLQKNSKNHSVIYCALKNPKSMAMLFENYPHLDLGAVLTTHTINQFEMLHWTINNPQSLAVILNATPKSLRTALLLHRGNAARPFIQRLAVNPKSLEVVKKYIPEISSWIVKDNRIINGYWETPDIKQLVNTVVLLDQIQQFQQYTQALKASQSNDINDKAYDLGNVLHTLVVKLNSAREAGNQTEEQALRTEFCQTLQTGYPQMRTQLEFIRSLLFNIILTATLIGFPIVLGKVALTGNGFFMTTKRQQMLDNIDKAYQPFLGSDNTSTKHPDNQSLYQP